MNTDQLKYFVELSESRSFNKTADKLEMTTSNLKKRIDLLEEELNVKLFIRSNKGLTLTPEGEMILDKARNILAQIDDLVHTYKETNEFVLGCDSIYLPDLVEDYFEDFCREKGFTPKLFAEHNYTELQKRLLHGDMEAFINLEEDTLEGIHFKKIREDKCYAITSPGFFKSKTINIPDLNGKTIYIDDRQSLKNRILLNLLSLHKVDCDVKEGIPQAESTGASRKGNGILIVQESFVRYFSRDMEYKEIEGYTVSSGLYYKTLTGKLLDLVKYIKDRIKQ